MNANNVDWHKLNIDNGKIKNCLILSISRLLYRQMAKAQKML